MTKQNEHKNIPELRFPEFRDDGEWEEESVGNIYEFKTTNSLSREYLSYDDGIIKNIHYGDIHTKFETLFSLAEEEVPYIKSNSIVLDKLKKDSYCKEGDMIFADASEDMDDIGKSIEILDLNNEKLVSGLHTILARPKVKKLVVGFGGYLFKSEPVRKQIQREAQGAKVLGISATRLSNVKISFPKNKVEQQKIADCLSSLDEVITVESDKLEVLKHHKKGLMQVLFPQEGEKVPKYRFPDFQDDGKWEEKTLGEIAEIVTGNTPSTKDLINYNGANLFVSPADISDKRYVTETKTTLSDVGFSKTRQIPANSVLFVCIGSTIGKIAQNRFECATNQQINSLIPFEGYLSDFLYSLLDYNSAKIASIAGNHAVPIINKTTFSTIKMKFPESREEQQKIAETLSSLDNLIAAQSEKIDQLKAHKKGLMQKLFPAIKE